MQEEQRQYGQADKFAEYLTDGETILWQGEGMSIHFEIPKAAVVMWLVISVLMFFAMLISDGLVALFMLPFVVIGIFAARFVLGSSAEYSYAVTDRRVMRLEVGSDKFDCKFYEDISSAHFYKRRRGGFDVVFFFKNRNNALSKSYRFSNIDKQNAELAVSIVEKYTERKE